jgi:hypothetical protein
MPTHPRGSGREGNEVYIQIPVDHYPQDLCSAVFADTR